MKFIKKLALGFFRFFYPSFLHYKKSYSQDGEDMIINSFYEGIKGYKGFYIDVGAHHPYRFSNTAFFYKKGWKGINIEPTPSLIKIFNKQRKRDINLNYGVSDTKEKLTFFEFDEPAINSFDEKLSNYRNENTKYKIIAKQEIEVLTLKEILNKHLPKKQKIDFLSIDVEGLDLRVLKSNDWEKFRPKYVLVEDLNNSSKLEQSEVLKFLKNHGYGLVGKSRRTFILKDKKNNEIQVSIIDF